MHKTRQINVTTILRKHTHQLRLAKQNNLKNKCLNSEGKC